MLNDFIQASDYGVTFDGTTDDTTDMQTAIDAAVGKTLVLSEGTAMISTTLTIPSDTRVIGNKTILKTTTGNTADPLIISVNSESNILIDGVTFDGNTGASTSFNYLIHVEGSTNVKFINCRWQNAKGISILFTDCIRSGVTQCSFKDCGVYHLTSSSSGDRRQAVAYTGDGLDNFTTFNTFDTVGLDCISVGKGLGTIGDQRHDISHNTIYSSYAGSIYISAAVGFRCIGNYVQNIQGGNGIDCNSPVAGLIANNVCINNGAAGIMVANGTRVNIIGNVCLNNYQEGTSTHKGGICLSASSGNTCSVINVSGNQCDDIQTTKTQEYGVYIADTAGTFARIRIDTSNQIKGYSGNVVSDQNAIFQSDITAGIGMTEFPQVFTLGVSDTALICPSTVRGMIEVQYLNSGHYGLMTIRKNQAPAEQLDNNNAFVQTDTGSTTAVYLTGSTVLLKNRTGLSGRAYWVSLRVITDVV